ncbi:MAG: hydrogenase iron-sulfur subunit [Chloroflexi bacterium]|nr:hydrogenase iron-sulfur subunit [Chloroflexota bacterium]
MSAESETVFEPQIVAFCCHYCAFAAADLAGSMRLQYPPNIKIIKIPCTGRVDAIHILKAFEYGADGVFVAGCLEGNCHYVEGNIFAKKRVNHLKKVLDEVGIDGNRLEMYNMSAAMGQRFAEVATEMTERIRQLGPSPARRRGDGVLTDTSERNAVEV